MQKKREKSSEKCFTNEVEGGKKTKESEQTLAVRKMTNTCKKRKNKRVFQAPVEITAYFLNLTSSESLVWVSQSHWVKKYGRENGKFLRVNKGQRRGKEREKRIYLKVQLKHNRDGAIGSAKKISKQVKKAFSSK